MKKIASILVLAFITISISAQSLIPIKFGIKVGTNISNITSIPNKGVKNIEKSAINGIAGGFYVEVAINDKWYLNPELVYSQKGASFTYEYTHNYDVNQSDVHNTLNELKLPYIEFNPTISYKATDKLALNFGPSFSFILTPEYNVIYDNGQNVSPHPDLPVGAYKEETIDFGLNLGFSYYLSEKILINSSVNTSFLKAGTISKLTNTGLVNGSQVNDPETNTYEIKNNVISFSFAYLL
tara:strand:+ start:5489 stop:6205 length:717 start_codon:yes stop_codon:yes gene_type:complete